MLASDPGKLPSNLNSLVLLAGDTGLTTLDVGKATDVKDAQVQSFFATDSDVVVLVWGSDELKMQKQHFRVTPLPGSSEAPSEFEDTQNVAERHHYILHFDSAGDLRSVHKLDDPFDYTVLAEFESGRLLLGGMPVGEKPRWAIADSDGAVRALLTLPEEAKLRQGAAKSFKTYGSSVPSTPESMFGMTQIVPYRDQLVAIPHGSGGNFYVVTETGEVRELHAQLPAGIEAGYAIPSQTSLYLRANDPRKAKDGLETGPIYSIDVETGALLQRFDTGEVLPSDVVCGSGSGFVAFHSGEGGLCLFKGSPQ